MTEELLNEEVINEESAEQEPGSETQEPEPEKKERVFTQDELNAIVQKEKAKAERKAYREMQPREQPREQQNDAPKRDQFETDDDWLDARDVYRDNQREAAQIVANAEKMYKQAEKIDGFDRDTFDALPLSKTIAQSIMDSDVGPKIMAYLVKNPDEAEDISSLKPHRQAAAIGRLEEKLSAPQTKTRAPLPEPAKTVGSKGGSYSDLNPNMSQSDFEAFLRKNSLIR